VNTHGYYVSASSAAATSEAPVTSGGPASSASSTVDSEATSVPEDAIPIPTNATSAGVSPTISGSAAPEATTFPIPSSVPKTNVTLPEGWKAAGCYVDPIRPRLFKFWASFGGQKMSSSKCVAYCDKQSFSFAGTENGGQCFCSNDLAEDAELKDESECSSVCKGAQREICGGRARLSVFTKLGGSDGYKMKRHLLKHRRSHDVLLS
jgi:WSC domain